MHIVHSLTDKPLLVPNVKAQVRDEGDNVRWAGIEMTIRIKYHSILVWANK